jgi:hypothetical protein
VRKIRTTAAAARIAPLPMEVLKQRSNPKVLVSSMEMIILKVRTSAPCQEHRAKSRRCNNTTRSKVGKVEGQIC